MLEIHCFATAKDTDTNFQLWRTKQLQCTHNSLNWCHKEACLPQWPSSSPQQLQRLVRQAQAHRLCNQECTPCEPYCQKQHASDVTITPGTSTAVTADHKSLYRLINHDKASQGMEGTHSL